MEQDPTKKCDICGIGNTNYRTFTVDGQELCYSECSYCGSEYAGPPEIALTKKLNQQGENDD